MYACRLEFTIWTSGVVHSKQRAQFDTKRLPELQFWQLKAYA